MWSESVIGDCPGSGLPGRHKGPAVLSRSLRNKDTARATRRSNSVERRWDLVSHIPAANSGKGQYHPRDRWETGSQDQVAEPALKPVPCRLSSKFVPQTLNAVMRCWALSLGTRPPSPGFPDGSKALMGNGSCLVTRHPGAAPPLSRQCAHGGWAAAPAFALTNRSRPCQLTGQRVPVHLMAGSEKKSVDAPLATCLAVLMPSCGPDPLSLASGSWGEAGPLVGWHIPQHQAEAPGPGDTVSAQVTGQVDLVPPLSRLPEVGSRHTGV